MKNFFLIIIIFALSNCGYNSVYKNMDKDNPKILIKSIQGDISINKILKRKLKRYELNESKRIFNLEAKTSFSKIVLSLLSSTRFGGAPYILDPNEYPIILYNSWWTFGSRKEPSHNNQLPWLSFCAEIL